MPRPRIPKPNAPVFPKIAPVRFAPVRAGESVDLDTHTTRSGLALPPFVRWDRFLAGDQSIRWAGFDFRQGEHITIIAPTGGGKTVLARRLLRYRDFVVVLGVKNRDPELYGPFEQEGYVLRRRFEVEPPAEADEARVLFVPQTDKHGAEARKIKGKAFRGVLNDVYDVGYWAVYADDIQYQADQLRLGPEFEELWMLGRSEKASVVAASQEPVDIPVMAYGMATHLFLFKNPDLYRARRMAELTGINREVTQETILKLPEHEFLYVNRPTGRMLRSKVIL